MIAKILRRMIYGIAYGAIAVFTALTILMILNVTLPIFQIWLYTLASLALGIYYGLASFIFELESWSPLKKTLVHYSLSITIYFTFALSLHWVPFHWKAILVTIIGFTIVYALFWFGYTLYYKRVESSLNDTLQKNK
ncbi:hypothetical protein J32TS6_25760 [Virgibacillus pantothenticus]|uniref:DUF3021 domain-containing protein n=1 Tax=Virgibacillus TaxID=84406 RepID=UPI00090CC030|nr:MULTISPECIES: DUF3021 domain-containing protein [Virgibacillus]API92137.1 hypothetical protein BKP57_10015 [Virgibacillus sp. 6R]MBS7427272.1 DUF3021 domain-containing protein [Virgibacillus sp. 19R1-5]MBU8568383.1 DUF3021 domain-containing protein [Virgibacillus pantothenticus]MBU8602345.1 DUF3021 domain-containing protein [Virgibacillus pantothenticus]MBU8636480.1 DUF3021 domain-containing protein [Virgibacillus pantothenticus]